MREWTDILADLWRMQKDAKGMGGSDSGGVKEFVAFAAQVNSGQS